jgi:hypothetical protein
MHACFAECQVAKTFRLPAPLAGRLVGVATERKFARERPFTQQDIISEALRQWLMRISRALRLTTDYHRSVAHIQICEREIGDGLDKTPFPIPVFQCQVSLEQAERRDRRAGNTQRSISPFSGCFEPVGSEIEVCCRPHQAGIRPVVYIDQSEIEILTV